MASRLHRCLHAALATFVAVSGTVAVVSVAIATAPRAGAANWAPAQPGDFPDPSILEWNNTYYGFSTQNFAPVATRSTSRCPRPATGSTGTASTAGTRSPTLGSWAEVGDTWAPSVVYDSTDNDFVMYYTATDIASGDQCIGMATSATPIGLYVDNMGRPVVCQNNSDPFPVVDNGNLGGSIDPDVFTDNSGNSWLIWKSDGNHIGGSTYIWSIPLNADDTIDASDSPTQLLTDDAAMAERNRRGPRHVRVALGLLLPLLLREPSRHDDLRARLGQLPSGPGGTCQNESLGGPLLGSQPGVSGPGGPDVYTVSGGQKVLAFAGWQGTTIGYLSCGFRPMYLADLSFGGAGGAPSLSPVDPNEAPASSPTCAQSPVPAPGYWQVASDGGVFTFGSAGFYGSTGSMRLNKPVVGMAVTPDEHGYWLVASDGGVFAFGDAGFYGSTGSMVLNKPIVSMIPTLDGHGYWLIASDGGVFAFGDATFYGSAGGASLAYPVTAAAPSFLGGGYWIVDSNGQVFSYGNARFEGQPTFAPGGYRITGMAATHSSNGYWLASANGNVATFGNAAYYGSEVGTALNAPIVGLSATFDGDGYWLQGGDGGIFTFGDAPFLGSMGGQHLNAPMVGITAA